MVSTKEHGTRQRNRAANLNAMVGRTMQALRGATSRAYLEKKIALRSTDLSGMESLLMSVAFTSWRDFGWRSGWSGAFELAQALFGSLG